MSPRSSIPGADDIARAELPNGLVVLARENPNSKAVTLRALVQVGGLNDPDDKLGLADFTASTLMRGTAARDFQQIYDSLESIGATFGFNSGTHTTSFGGRTLAEDFGLLLDLAREALYHPAFPNDHVEKVRAQLLTGLALRAQDTRDMASLIFDELVYRQHPYARADEGHPHTISAITREDLVAFHQRHFGPRGAIVVVVGGIGTHKAIEQVRAAFEDWQNPEQPPVVALPAWDPMTARSYRRLDIPGKSQSDLIVGTVGPLRKSPDYMPASLGNNILGRFGLMGRVGDSVREKAGLAYYAYSSLGGGVGPDPWLVAAGVNPASEEQATELIFKEIERFATELVTEEELSDSKSNYIGSMPLSLESNGGVADALMSIERFDLGLDYYRHFPDEVSAVTREQVLAAAAQYLVSDKLAVAVAGPERPGA
jgi:zinc protease